MVQPFGWAAQETIDRCLGRTLVPAHFVLALQRFTRGLGRLLGLGLGRSLALALDLHGRAGGVRGHGFHQVAAGRLVQHDAGRRHVLAQHLAHGRAAALAGLVQQQVATGRAVLAGHDVAGLAAGDDLLAALLGLGLHALEVGVFLFREAGGVGTDVCIVLVPQFWRRAGVFGADRARAGGRAQRGIVQCEGGLVELEHVAASRQVQGAAIAHGAAVRAAREHALGVFGLDGLGRALGHQQGHAARQRARCQGGCGIGAQREQAQRFKDVSAALVQGFGSTVDREAVVQGQALHAQGLLQGREVAAVQVLDQLHQQRVHVVRVALDVRHGAQARNLGGAVPALARNDFVRGAARGLVLEGVLQALDRQAAQQQGLQHAVQLHGGGHVVESVVLDHPAIRAAGRDLGEGQRGVHDRAGVSAVLAIGLHDLEGVHGQVDQAVAHGDLVLPPAGRLADHLAALAGLGMRLAALACGLGADHHFALDQRVFTFGSHGWPPFR